MLNELSTKYITIIIHQARPCALFNIRESFNDFLKSTDGDFHKSLDELSQMAGIRLVVTDRDPDGDSRVASSTPSGGDFS